MAKRSFTRRFASPDPREGGISKWYLSTRRLRTTEKRRGRYTPSTTEGFAEVIGESRRFWEPHLEFGKARADAFIERVAAVDMKYAESGEVNDEQLWTFLTALGYAVFGKKGVQAFARQLTGLRLGHPSGSRIWLEVLPISPRFSEGATNLDIAIGCIRRREGTTGGVELLANTNSWVCFVEAKWYSDIGTKVTGHPERNQLARVAENAVAFQSLGSLVAKPMVTLLTPRRFKDSPTGSRLYAYKYAEYASDRHKLGDEWNYVSDRLPPRRESNWSYPEQMSHQLSQLGWRWKTFEELLSVDTLPDSMLKQPLLGFARRWNGTGSGMGDSR